MGKLFEQIHVIDWTAVGTVDIDTNTTVDWISVANYRRGLVIFNSPAGTAADDWNIVIRQAKTAAGGTPIDLDIVSEYWTKQAATNLTSITTFTRTSQTADAAVSGDAESAEEVGLVVLDLDFAGMDSANGYTFIGCDLSQDASNAAQICALNLILYDPRYPQATPLGALS